MRLTTIRGLAAALTLAALGCSDATAPDSSSHLSVTVSGAVNYTFGGTLTAGISALGGENSRLYRATLRGSTANDGIPNGVLNLFRFAPADVALGAGVYPVADATVTHEAGPFFGNFDTPVGSRADNSYHTTGGTVTIDAISATRVKGRFDLQMSSDDIIDTPRPTVRLVGTFDGPNNSLVER